jgi:hypothetical protein
MSAPEKTTFALERFAWDSPDRLGLSGWFSGLPDAPLPADPVIVVHGTDGTHRLPAVSAGAASPEDGRLWEAAFAWQEPPTPFAVAELQLGDGIVVELPEPGAGLPGPDDRLPEGGAEQLRLEADLVAAQEELRDALARLDQTEHDLVRAREDLDAEHARHTEDAKRFREGLDRVRESAERALATERLTVQQLELELRRSHGELDALREELAEHERAASDADVLRAELETARRQSDEAQARLREAREPVAVAHAESEQLLRRLAAIARALDARS